MNSAYVVGHISIINTEKWNEYRNQVAATLEPWGGELVFRGKKSAILAGANPHSDIVVIRFPDQMAIDNWHSSAAYQALIPLRQQAAEIDLLCYEA